MGKNWIKIIFISLFGFCCTNESSKFYEMVLNNFNSPHTYYILLPLKSPNYTGMVIIKNEDLFYYFERRRGVTEREEYVTMMKRILRKKESLVIEDSNSFDKWEFRKIFLNREVDELALKGKSYFFDKYTHIVRNNRILRPMEDYDKRKAIIAKLFEMDIAVYIDDESGAAVIRELPRSAESSAVK